MSAPWGIFAFILILGFLVFIHELGHYATAKFRGVKVLEFGIGFPPRIFAFRRGETEYSINLIPIGGFTKMLGEEDPAEPRSLARQGVGTRLLVLSAGSLMMFLFPVVLFTGIFMAPHDVVVGGEGIEIVQVVTDSPADVSGFKSGDVILSMDGQAMTTFDDLKETSHAGIGQELLTKVLRDSKEIELSVIPRETWPPGQGPLGIGLTWANQIIERKTSPPWEAISSAAQLSWQMVIILKDGIVATFSGQVPVSVTGIIGIGQATTTIAKNGTMQLLQWAAFLSVNLGIVNLLPIPALDGGRIVFVIVEVLRRGKRVSAKVEGMTHMVGFMILIGFMVIVAYYDIIRLVRGESLFP